MQHHLSKKIKDIGSLFRKVILIFQLVRLKEQHQPAEVVMVQRQKEDNAVPPAAMSEKHIGGKHGSSIPEVLNNARELKVYRA